MQRGSSTDFDVVPSFGVIKDRISSQANITDGAAGTSPEFTSCDMYKYRKPAESDTIAAQWAELGTCGALLQGS
jgi:hypothetical protein